MAYYVKFKNRTPLGGSESLSCWTYEISTDEGDFPAGDRWGLGFNTNLDIKTPENYAKCNHYNLGFKGATDAPVGWVVSSKLVNESDRFDLSFVAPSHEDRNTHITLERWSGEHEIWIQVDFKGWSDMLGPMGEAN